MPPIGFSHLFSYWLFAWAVAYYTFFIVLRRESRLRADMNPLPALALAFVENVIMAAVLLARRSAGSAAKLMLFSLVTKGLLMYLLRNEPVALVGNAACSVALFVAYSAYLACVGTSVFAVYRRISKSLLAGNNATPAYAFVEKFR